MICLKLKFLKIIKNIFKENFQWVWVLEVVYISYNTGTRVLPDIYALALRRCAPLGIVHIYQATYSCLCYNLSRLTIVSREAKKKQQPLSELFTWTTTKKLGNAQAKPP